MTRAHFAAPLDDRLETVYGAAIRDMEAGTLSFTEGVRAIFGLAEGPVTLERLLGAAHFQDRLMLGEMFERPVWGTRRIRLAAVGEGETVTEAESHAEFGRDGKPRRLVILFRDLFG
ncbi:hypothetical protein [Gellertiella hungarica]|uniref:Uncharacterized protein n=1 Tax=Gellertiella hungarica TaxID=1572859 RepID=A0A7W6NKL5_9HYPH|nr:hypothetical protein [Gellertiella hungarica]MBB4065003.1 hypothetical protein [Gellertiella hungarica]